MMTKKATDLKPADVAAELGVHRETVLRMLRDECLCGYLAGGQWRVTRKALDLFKASGGKRPVGRPRIAPVKADLATTPPRRPGRPRKATEATQETQTDANS